MADDNSVKEPDNTKPDGAKGEPKSPSLRPPLPPLTSSRPASGARPPLPPLSSAQRPAAPATPKPAQPVVAPPAASGVASPVQATPAPPKPAPAAAQTRKPRQDKPPENDQGIWRMNRKNFLNVAGWLAFLSFLVTATVGAIRLMVPRVLYEAPSAFKAGFPSDYVVGEVNEKYKDEFRVWVIRDTEGLYALSAICTHLGCTPRWLPSDNKFKCPCHGSGYFKDGVNFEGPTPRPLERLKITLADDGQILIDRNIKFLYEKQEWGKPDAFLKYA